MYGFSDSTVKLMSSFLSNRQQLVCVNVSKSDFKTVRYGVPQGSILGPLLFILYINDLPLYIESTCDLFADDSSVHCNHDCPKKLKTTIQESINA